MFDNTQLLETAAPAERELEKLRAAAYTLDQQEASEWQKFSEVAMKVHYRIIHSKWEHINNDFVTKIYENDNFLIVYNTDPVIMIYKKERNFIKNYSINYMVNRNTSEL